jgi:hypothetical protein
MLLLSLCALVAISLSLEAKKRPLPAAQQTAEAKAHRAMAKDLQKSRKVKKHRQRVN